MVGVRPLRRDARRMLASDFAVPQPVCNANIKFNVLKKPHELSQRKLISDVD